MARKKHGRRRRRGMGSIITVRRLSGVERLSNPASMTGAILPAALGGGAALLTTVGIRQWVSPTPDNAKFVDNAELIGLGVGLLTGLALWNTSSKPAGLAALTGAGLVTLAVKLPSMLSGVLSPMPAGTAGMGAIVAQQMSGARRRGMGAVVFQPPQPGAFGPGGGEVVSLNGVRGVNPSVFGTPSYRM